MAIAMTIAAVLLVFALALSLATPVRVEIRAPDGGDLASMTIRHPAIALEVWLPPEVPLGWALGERTLPPLNGHLAGIPVDRALLRRLFHLGARATTRARKARSKSARVAPRPPRVTPPRADPARHPWVAHLPARAQRPAIIAHGVWMRERGRVRRAGRIDVLEIDLRYGTGDPATTGIVAGLLWDLCATLPPHFAVRAEADWSRPTLHVEGETRFVVFPWRVCVAAICLGFAAWRERRAFSRSALPEESHRWQRTDTVAPSSRS